jgi:hypothetical protein
MVQRSSQVANCLASRTQTAPRTAWRELQCAVYVYSPYYPDTIQQALPTRRFAMQGAQKPRVLEDLRNLDPIGPGTDPCQAAVEKTIIFLAQHDLASSQPMIRPSAEDVDYDWPIIPCEFLIMPPGRTLGISRRA